MTINESELSSLSAKLKSNINTFVTDANIAINTYVAKVNTIWCSGESVKAHGSLSQILKEFDKKIEERAFTNEHGINASVGTNVKNFNTSELGNHVWNKIQFSEPNVSKISTEVKREFKAGVDGVMPDNSPADLEKPFKDITDCYIKLCKNFISTVSSSNAFDEKQKSAFITGISDVSNEITKATEQIDTIIRDGFKKEADRHKELEDVTTSNFGNM